VVAAAVTRRVLLLSLLWSVAVWLALIVLVAWAVRH
jgi:hypothetical protein